jgi:hypothetical protein
VVFLSSIVLCLMVLGEGGTGGLGFLHKQVYVPLRQEERIAL